MINPSDIHYVKSEETPADMASRGATSEDFIANKIWFNGPAWLQNDELPKTPCKEEQCVSFAIEVVDVEFLNRFSNWKKMLRVLSKCLRWVNVIKRNKNATINRFSEPLSSEEILRTRNRIIRRQQELLFSDVIEKLEQNKSLPKKCWMTPLNPFIDDRDNLLRIGGRLTKAKFISENQRHPIILQNCHIIEIIIRDIHLNFGHAGNQLIEKEVRETYHIPALKSKIKKCIRNCVTCLKWNAKTNNQMMLASFKWISVRFYYHAFRTEIEMTNFFGIIEANVEELELRDIRCIFSRKDNILAPNMIFPKLRTLRLADCNTYIYSQIFQNVKTIQMLHLETKIFSAVDYKDWEFIERVKAFQTILRNNQNLKVLGFYLHQTDFDNLFIDDKFLCGFKFQLEALKFKKFRKQPEPKSKTIQMENFQKFLSMHNKTLKYLELNEWLGNDVLETVINTMDNLYDGGYQRESSKYYRV
ncbi:CLUMA_CG016760, isoform A [Clunio marinus]|uniref:CLUMA_CG016760, isoform A n=1 Tax=Clunio marinus TaxID=568069 RepID=A0A1J1IU66_9DIPT|nr:CLUMA_CG016760, isoform A [Clunio marinus]